MKKLLFLILCIISTISNVNAEEMKDIKLVKCASLSNIWISDREEIKRIHLAAFETPSGTLDKEINEYVCRLLTNAVSLKVEYATQREDKYNRSLVYLYVDGKMLQEDLLEKGYGEVDSVTENFKYITSFCNIQSTALRDKKGIWTYPNISEKYCNSGITINNTKPSKEIKNINQEIKVDIKYLILINSAILVLLLLMKRNF